MITTMHQSVLQLGCYSNPGSDLLSCALGDLAASVGGQAVFGLLAGGLILTSFYVASNGGLATPATLTAITGAILVGALPPAYQGMAMIIIFLGIAGGLLATLSKFVDATPRQS